MQKLQDLCPIPIHVVWHENKSTFLTIRKERKRLHLRLHRLFLEAPTPVLEALIRMALKPDAGARAIVRQMAHLYFSQNRSPAKASVTQGSFYDLNEIYTRIKNYYFTPDYDASIGWSAPTRRGKFRSITFGTYDRHRHQIRINPLLDHAEVPLYFIEFIVYHEMLHAVCPARIDARGSIRVHTPEFRKEEKRFASYNQAKEWEKKSLQFFKGKMRKQNGRA